MRTTHHPVAAALWLAALVFAGCSRPDARVGDICTSVDDCAGSLPLACSQSECVQVGCERSAECPAGAACVDGACTQPECIDDESCLRREQCFEGDCRGDLCEFKADCDDGEVCLGVPPQCTAPPERCTLDTQCPRDLFCKTPEGVCEPRCTADTSCAEGSYCDGDFCRLACVTSSDCPDGDVCAGGRCIENMCAARTCDDTRPFVDPVTCSCVACLADRDCAVDRNEACNDGGACTYCPSRASSESVCLDGGLLLDQGCCVECVADDDCPNGTICASGRCVLDDPRDCATDADCPGARCDLGWCVLPGSMTPCELQTDCPAGEACYSDGRCRAEGQGCDGCGAPGRCVSEPGNLTGTCAGCTVACATDGCPAGTLCFRPTGAAEGYCAASESVSACE